MGAVGPAWLVEITDASTFWRADLFSCVEDVETISSTTPEQATQDWIDQQAPDWQPTGTVTVWAFARRVVPDGEPDADQILEDVIERLDEEYGGPDDPTELTAEMKAAAQEFADKIRAAYFVWQCESVASAVVDLAAFSKAEGRE